MLHNIVAVCGASSLLLACVLCVCVQPSRRRDDGCSVAWLSSAAVDDCSDDDDGGAMADDDDEDHVTSPDVVLAILPAVSLRLRKQ